MTELCLRCGQHPVADEGPPYFPFCAMCWPLVRNYSVDENGDFLGFRTEEEELESLRQSGEAAIAAAEEEGWLNVTTQDASLLVPLLRADPHRWGAGLIHLIDPDRDQTMCGKSPGGCPGTKFYSTRDRITCRSCLRSIEAKAQAAVRLEQYRREAAESEREREANNRLWWQRYDTYLLTPTWRGKRARVLERANGRCEGCGERRATQVHHERYPQGCWPGSDEWIAQEKLFDLIAICAGCHTDVHGRRR